MAGTVFLPPKHFYRFTMHLHRLLLLLLPAFTFLESSCAQNSPPAAALSGMIVLRDGWERRVYLVKPAFYKQLISPYEGALVDSTDVGSDGAFAFRDLSSIRENGIYLLFSKPAGSRFYNEIVDPPAENYACLVLGPGIRTRLEGNAWELARSYRLLEAGPESHLMAQIRDCRAPLFRETPAPPVAAPEEEYGLHDAPAAQKAANAALDAFLDTTLAVLPTFAALRLRAPENAFRERPEFFLRILARLRSQAPDDPWTNQLAVFLDPSQLPVLQGEKMPGFALPTPDGDTLRLSDVQSKLLLVDFWASWCAPCRVEARATIRPLYDEYHAKGFNVLGVSIDRGREAWVAAIRKDGAMWPNVSDLLGDASPVRQALKFEYIPSNYLLDAEGRLLARNLHREELRIFVKNYIERQ